MSITRALREWQFRIIPEPDVIRLFGRDTPKDRAVMAVLRIKGARRDFAPYVIGDRVVVWVPATSTWWLSPAHWRPRKRLDSL